MSTDMVAVERRVERHGADLRPALVETHSAVVVFMGDRSYKVKKPVDLGFLDFSTRDDRQSACRREVYLNRRLAPDVYEGVADIIGPDGRACDHMVVMRRLPAERRLSTLALASEPLREELWHVAAALADLHARSTHSCRINRAAGVDAMHTRWAANTTEMLELGGAVLDDVKVGLVHGLACRYLDGRASLLADRIVRRRAVDGHGDLLAEDIFCLEDGPRILDCIEFDEDLRLGDGLADAAFLAMDLEHLGRPDLAAHFLASYGELRDDTWPVSLAHHHIAYRAQVRSKVMALRAEQGDPLAAGEARAFLDLALGHLEAARVRLVLVGGLPGTGKTTVAGELARRMGWTLLRSDEIRKRLADVPPGERRTAAVESGIYTRAWTDRTYTALLSEAEALLAMGESVVLDASWASGCWRGQARAAAERVHVDVVELQCMAPEEVTLPRITERLREGSDASDATPEVASALAGTFDPWPAATVVDTAVALPHSTAVALAKVQGDPGTR